jgi:hypothetical protein
MKGLLSYLKSVTTNSIFFYKTQWTGAWTKGLDTLLYPASLSISIYTHSYGILFTCPGISSKQLVAF